MRTVSRFLLSLCVSLVLTLGFTPGVYAQTATPSPTIKVTQVDNSKFPQVTVYVSVTDANGEPLGIDPTQIQLSENGQPVQTTAVKGAGATKGPGQVNTFLLIDVSGSMATAGKLASAKQAAKAYIDQMRPGDQGGVISYNTTATVNQALTSDHAALASAIDSLQAGGDTAMFDALIQAQQQFKNVGGRDAIILITDGLDNRSKSNLDGVIKGIGPSGMTISTIGLGNPQDAGNLRGIDQVTLKALADKGGGVYSFAPDPAALSALYQQYGRNLQSEYALTYTSSVTLRDGVNRNLTVALTGSTAAVTTQYNPGGVLPEVASQSWPLFLGIFLVLLALLAVPFILNRASGGFKGFGQGSKKGRVKLASEPAASPQQRSRIKMK